MSTTEDKLRKQLDKDYAKAWIPETKGDTIVGTMLRLEQGTTSFGPAPVVIIAEEGTGEERAIWLFTEAIRSGFNRARPAVGERVAVRYLGKQKVKNQTPGRANEYHNFKVAVDRPDGTQVDWAGALNVPAAADVIDEDDAPF